MLIILVVVLSVSTLLYSEIKVIRNMGNSVASFYAAESGIEKVLYYDRQVRLISTDSACPTGTECLTNQVCDNGYCANIVPRGLCMMLDQTKNSNKYCAPSGSSLDQSIYCKILPGNISGADCDANTCTNCTVSFETTFEGRTYTTTTIVAPVADKLDPGYNITSKGTYGGTQREIQTTIIPIK